MDRITLLGFVIFIFYFEYITAKPPVKTNPVIKDVIGSEIVVEAKHDLTLLCEGREKITWTYPNNTVDGTYWSTINVETSESNGKFLAKLTLKNASFGDVDYYYCHADNAAKDDVQRSTKIYVFVRDDEHLSVKPSEEIEFITANQYSEVILPCRPTSPDISVTLFDINEEPMDLPFDRHIGFTFEITSLLQTGHYNCVFKLGNKKEELMINVNVGSETEFVPRPFIDALNGGKTSIGATYTLNCTVTVDQNVYFTLNWIIPNPDAEKSGRIFKTTAQAHDVNGVRQGSSTLTIKNVQFEDGGEYICNIEDHNHKNNSGSKNITVFDTEGSYINLQEESGRIVINTTAGSQLIQWVVTVDSFPTASIEWRNNKGDEIMGSFKNSKYYTDYNNISNKATLKIHQITLNDSGVYQIVANNGKTEKNLNLTLIVQDRPTVDIKSHNYHIFGENTSLECIAAGFPIPTVEWSFKPCENNSCDFKKLPRHMYTSQTIGLQTVSTLIMNATVTGLIQCFASNSIDNDTYTQGFYITDVEDGQRIWSSERNDQVASGSNIEINCAVSKYNYTNDITWYMDNGTEAYPNRMRLLPNKKFHIKNYTTAYTYRSTLTINNIMKSDKAIYMCVTKLLESNNDIQIDLSIVVEDPKKPEIYKTNMNGSTYTTSVGHSVRWYCEASGIPTPTISWKKDNYDWAKGVNHNHIKISEDNTLLEFSFLREDDSGTYSCEAKNSKGTVKKSMKLEVHGSNRGSSTTFIVVVVALAIFFFALVLVLVVKIKKEKKLRRELKIAGLMHFEKGALESLNPDLGIDEQAELLPYDKKWEFPRDKLKLGKQLGSGAFGVVMKAEAFGIVEGESNTTVAVKMVKRNADYTYIKALASELKIMVHLGKHLNVVNLLGACTKNVTKRELLVIVEYCRFGNLHNYLLRHRDDFVNQIDLKTGQIDTSIGAEFLNRTMSVGSNHSETRTIAFAGVDYRAAPNPTSVTDSSISCSPTGDDTMILSNNSSVQPEWRSNYRGDYKGNVRPTSTHDLLCWAFQVARGMEYLASRKVMHGDLAARNILLSEENIVKICDFGLAKSMYKSDNYKKKGDGPLPVKWMAVESIRDRVFSTQSDVWSYGIVLWELFSLSRTPYPGMDADERLYNKLVDGYRMDQPEYATKEIYQIMLECWHAKPVYRPSFTKLADDLGNMLQDTVRKHYIDLNDPYIMMNNEQLAGHSDYLAMACSPDYGNLASPGHEYVNGKQFPEEQEPEASGYLPMDIFSPRSNDGSVFSFDVAKNKNIKEETPTAELVPMLHANESDNELSPSPTKSFSNPNYQMNPTVDSNKISDPKKDSILPSSDNYINMPQQKNAMKTNTDSFMNPSYIHMNNKSIINEENEKNNYVNSHSRDWERPIV